eukprot:GFUD01038841.1.p1 GENE.GFUD01038841.1~~GFUD01038841.1.p1  ORF type:complete len:269 (+),score=72.90 GFUD01038841.1:50-856(+)
MLGKIVRTAGHLYCTLALFLVSLVIELLDFLIRKLVSIVTNMTGIENKKIKPWIQTYSTEPVWTEKNFLDEQSMLNNSDFPIKPADLIEKCKVVVRHQFGSEKPELLSEDFQFIFPVVGPLPKAEFVEAFSSFKVEEAFTGSYNYFGFNVDPMEPNRVWFFSRGVLTHSGVLLFGAMKMKPTGTTVVTPPQVLSMSFNREGECYKMTGGYSVDRTVGNTGGLGAIFGLIHAIGGSLPFPEGKPWKPSLRWEAFSIHVPAIMNIWKRGK